MSEAGDLERRINDAIETIMGLGSYDGGHHKQYALDQALRVLTDCPIETRTSRNGKYTYEALGESDLYKQLCIEHMAGEDGPYTYGEWEEGTPP